MGRSGQDPGVVVSLFDHITDIEVLANCETKTTSGIDNLLVSFDSEIRQHTI